MGETITVGEGELTCEVYEQDGSWWCSDPDGNLIAAGLRDQDHAEQVATRWITQRPEYTSNAWKSRVDVRLGTLSDDEVEALKAAAGQAGDMHQVSLCEMALAGDSGARWSCAEAILDAEGR